MGLIQLIFTKYETYYINVSQIIKHGWVAFKMTNFYWNVSIYPSIFLFRGKLQINEKKEFSEIYNGI